MKAIDFIQNLKLCEDYSGKPFVLRDWQKEIVKKIFAEKEGVRQYRTCFLMLPRKQAKTTLCAALALYFLFCEQDGQQIILVNSSVKTAGEMFRKIMQMRNTNPFLKEHSKAYTAIKQLKYNNSEIIVLSNNLENAYGWNPSVLLFDEIVAQGKTKDLYQILTSSFGARENPLTIAISTAGEDDKESLLKELYTYAKKVQADPTIDQTFLPIIYESYNDWKEESSWHASMPALGDFCSLDFIRSEFTQAQELPSKEISFRTLYLNQFVSNISAFIEQKKWMQCQTDELGDSKFATMGIDLAARTAMTAVVLYFDDGKILPHFWITEESIRHRSSNQNSLFSQWVRQGYITQVDGNLIPTTLVQEKIVSLCEQYQVRRIGLDDWNAYDLGANLLALGHRVEFVSQSTRSLNSPTKELQALVLEKKLKHNHPVMDYQMSMLKVKTDSNGNIRPCKESSADTIDGPVALIMAIHMALAYPKASIYESGGSLAL